MSSAFATRTRPAATVVVIERRPAQVEIEELRRTTDAGGIDLARSSGVLGFRRDAGALYVALDPDDPAPAVALGPGTGDAPETLVQSRWPVRGLRRTADGFGFRASGFGPGEMRWRAAPGARYLLTTDSRVSTEIAADAAGELALAVPAADGREIAFTLRRVAP